MGVSARSCVRSKTRLRNSGTSTAQARDKATLMRKSLGKASRGDRQTQSEAKIELQMVDREAEKKVVLSTIWINYLDLRCAALSRNRRSYSYLSDHVFFSFLAHKIAASWHKKHDVPIEKIISKMLLMIIVEAVTIPFAIEIDLIGKSTLSRTTVSHGDEGVMGR